MNKLSQPEIRLQWKEGYRKVMIESENTVILGFKDISVVSKGKPRDSFLRVE